MLNTLSDRIKLHEGFRERPYVCPTGHASIGYGCNLEAHPGYIADPATRREVELGKLKGSELVARLRGQGMFWTSACASATLAIQLEDAEQEVAERWPWAAGLFQARREVLVEMAFQMGAAKLATFRKFLAAAEAGDFERAAEEMLDSKWARADSPDRAAELANVMRVGGAP